jgi:cytidyltransferase-like protein
MKPQYGYAAVTADFLHIGHIEFLKACKEHCENLIVGVMADECVEIYKGKRPIMNQMAREEIIKSLKFVHKTIIQTEFDFPHYVFRLKEFYEKDFVIIDSDEHEHKRKSDIIIIGGIDRKHKMSSSLLRMIK